MTTARATLPAVVFLLGACQSVPEYPTTLDMTTWSVAAIDPATGDVGVAGASCVPTHADALAALVPGKGAGATQAAFDVDNRNVVYAAIQEGLNPRVMETLLKTYLPDSKRAIATAKKKAA